jgi:hypothetical protein
VIDVVRGAGRIEVDYDRRLVAVRGGWWYRGDESIAADSGATS